MDNVIYLLRVPPSFVRSACFYNSVLSVQLVRATLEHACIILCMPLIWTVHVGMSCRRLGEVRASLAQPKGSVFEKNPTAFNPRPDYQYYAPSDYQYANNECVHCRFFVPTNQEILSWPGFFLEPRDELVVGGIRYSGILIYDGGPHGVWVPSRDPVVWFIVRLGTGEDMTLSNSYYKYFESSRELQQHQRWWWWCRWVPVSSTRVATRILKLHPYMNYDTACGSPSYLFAGWLW